MDDHCFDSDRCCHAFEVEPYPSLPPMSSCLSFGSAANALGQQPPQPRTMALQSFATHAKQIIYFQSHGNAWKTTSAEALAEAVKNHRIAIHQLSPYRTRVIAFDSKVWFFDLYFSQCFTSSDTWERKMVQLLEESTNNGGVIGITLLKRFYPLRECLSDLPKIDWERLEGEPFRDD